jgi:hypothetical protein
MITDNLVDKIGSGHFSTQEKQTDPFDQLYDEGNKKHRNFLSKLDHGYTIISHPFTIVVLFVLVFAVFVLTRYLGLIPRNDIASKISGDAGIALTYLLAVIGTSVFTKFLEKNHKNQQ